MSKNSEKPRRVGSKVRLPEELCGYGGRQRELLVVIYQRAGATTRQIYEALENPPQSIMGLTTLLGRMTERGVLKKRRSGRRTEMLYIPTVSTADVQLRAFRRIAKLHFRGSRKDAVAALAKLAAEEEGRSDIAA